MSGTIEFGLDVGVYGPLALPMHILPLAQQAEAAGFSSLWLADHVVFPKQYDSKYPYSPTGTFPVEATEPLMEPIATMGVLAGATTRLRLGTAVLVMPYRNPVLLGRMLATIDQFAGGRVVLGAGVGWLEEEFIALDTRDFAARGAVTDECLEIVKLVAGGGLVEYSGEHYAFEPIEWHPGSIARPHPPILIGGTSNRALRRVVEQGDGWLSVSLDVEGVGVHLEKLKSLCLDRDRDYATLELQHKIFLSIDQEKPSIDGTRALGTGGADTIRDDVKRIADLGYRGVIMRYIGRDAEEQRVQIDRFANEVMAKV